MVPPMTRHSGAEAALRAGGLFDRAASLDGLLDEAARQSRRMRRGSFFSFERAQDRGLERGSHSSR